MIFALHGISFLKFQFSTEKGALDLNSEKPSQKAIFGEDINNSLNGRTQQLYGPGYELLTLRGV